MAAPAATASPTRHGRSHDKLRLARDGRLPPRTAAPVVPDYEVPTLAVEDARRALDRTIAGALAEVMAWQHDRTTPLSADRHPRHRRPRQEPHHPRPGTTAAPGTCGPRTCPARVLWFTPSHALASETAAALAGGDETVAVLHGYDAVDPVTREPMCRDREAVQAALRSGLGVHGSVCDAPGGRRCAFFDTCLKQRNRRAVADADIVVAAYDALFSGFAFETDDVALLVIDEGCWSRAVTPARDLTVTVEDLASESVAGLGNSRVGERAAGAMADLADARQKACRALQPLDPGPVTRAALVGAGLDEGRCRAAAHLERRRIENPGLVPGLGGKARARAIAISRQNERIRALASIWTAMADLIASGRPSDGRVRLQETAAGPRIAVQRVQSLHQSLAGHPVLHLDATLRPDLARTILPHLRVAEIAAATPHLHLRMIAGSFGKAGLCDDARAAADERQRRANRLADCVDYVRWQARRVSPGRVLVVTYMACEAAFTGIPNVEVAHFNAVAGLDCYGDIALLISIGRPLPSEADLHPLCGRVLPPRPEARLSEGPRRRTHAQRHVGVSVRHPAQRRGRRRAARRDLR